MNPKNTSTDETQAANTITNVAHVQNATSTLSKKKILNQ